MEKKANKEIKKNPIDKLKAYHNKFKIYLILIKIKEIKKKNNNNKKWKIYNNKKSKLRKLSIKQQINLKIMYKNLIKLLKKQNKILRKINLNKIKNKKF